MITVNFFEGKKGFRISGHSGYSHQGSDIVCSSVSSAVYLVANTVTDIIGAEADIKVEDGFMELKIREVSHGTDILIDGLRLHLTQLSEQYPQYVIVKD